MPHTSATLNPITERIIGCAFTVANTLKQGFSEKVYENALAHELGKAGLTVDQQFGIVVHYDDIVVGTYTADILVEKTVLVELKAVRALGSEHVGQCVNYLAATHLPLCLLLNFGARRLEVKRVARFA